MVELGAVVNAVDGAIGVGAIEGAGNGVSVGVGVGGGVGARGHASDVLPSSSVQVLGDVLGLIGVVVMLGIDEYGVMLWPKTTGALAIATTAKMAWNGAIRRTVLSLGIAEPQMRLRQVTRQDGALSVIRGLMPTGCRGCQSEIIPILRSRSTRAI